MVQIPGTETDQRIVPFFKLADQHVTIKELVHVPPYCRHLRKCYRPHFCMSDLSFPKTCSLYFLLGEKPDIYIASHI